jgi:hypothetical protein
MVRFSAGASLNALAMTFARFPERDGVAGESWRPGAEGPRERAYVSEVLAWAQGFRPHVVEGVKGRL